jgi:hypothetical protein
VTACDIEDAEAFYLVDAAAQFRGPEGIEDAQVFDVTGHLVALIHVQFHERMEVHGPAFGAEQAVAGVGEDVADP